MIRHGQPDGDRPPLAYDVPMTDCDLSRAAWRKATRSHDQTIGTCVEVATVEA
jgi:hypothetical protein